MYNTKDGRFSFLYPIMVKDEIECGLHPDIFKCDSLMSPIVSVFNSKGYRTDNCCAGHIGNGYVDNRYYRHHDVIKVDNDRPISESYVSFLATPKLSPIYKFELPKRWYIEFYRDNYFTELTKDNYLDAEGYPFSIRLNMSQYVEKLLSKDEYDDFAFYTDLIQDLRNLYNYAKSLPDLGCIKLKSFKLVKEKRNGLFQK